MKQMNSHVVAILTFELLLSTGTMEWIPKWSEAFKSEVWLPFTLYFTLLVGIITLFYYMTAYIPFTENNLTLFDTLLGKYLGAGLNLLLVFFLITYASQTCINGIKIIQYAALPYTPIAALLLVGLLIPIQLIPAGFEPLIRYQVSLFYPALSLAIFLLIMSFRFSNLHNFLPLWLPVQPTFSSFLTNILELLPGLNLFVVYLVIFKKHQAALSLKSMLLGTGGVATLNFINLYLALAVLGPFESATLHWPVLEVVRVQKMASSFIERLDLIFLVPILVAMSSALNLYLYAANYILTSYLPFAKWIVLTITVSALGFLVILPHYFVHTTLKIQSMINFFNLFLVIVCLPVFFIRFLLIKKKEVHND
ncbi:GerAB/ArcD/ProY family transporter [Sulfoacidibacillus thermotolerans]|uniref:Uncharacterized protein n=1 Tax=Sulfoacidibacillus thermotolerans TaxID=1765684 RepID=A0A2U3DC93_SULT2|nr:GerAB/ArcD/ProY family transporter [Sulfoacidibacillus thermotolerans]PWI58907.1 hypothetical protein BM613_02155 [Sulfoacidibacillus thermotolerans]